MEADSFNQQRENSMDEFAIRSQEQVAELMAQQGYPMTRSRVAQIEKSAFRKLRANPVFQRLFADLC